MKLAIIDIGSNSVRLMLWADGKTLYKKVATTRLGEGIAERGELSEDAMARTISAICSFCEEAIEEGACVYAFATAAVRSAKNRSEFCDRVYTSCAVEVDVISGETEAALGMLGALGGEDGGIIDIGGASTEVAFRMGGNIVFATSLPLGAVKLYDICGDDADKLLMEIGKVLPMIASANAVLPIRIIGGTASTLASVRLGLVEYDGKRLHDLPLSSAWLRETADRLLGMTAAERRKIAGMDVRRADIIAGGALLLSQIVDDLNISEVYFSDSDNLEGYRILRGLS